jgi:hypothetical protein
LSDGFGGDVEGAAAAGAVPEHLVCYVCHSLPAGRVEQCANGHLLCAEAGPDSCLAGLRAHAFELNIAPKCFCSCPLPPVLNRCLVAEQTIVLLPAACPHCAQSTTRGDLTAHEVACPSAPDVGCAAAADEGCAWEGREAERAAHKAGCALVVRQRALSVHRGREGDGATPLYVAAELGQDYEVALLIAAGADVNKARTDTGATPLHVATERGHLDVVERLLAAPGVDVNTACSNVATALSLALAQGHAEVVQKLRAAGAN